MFFQSGVRRSIFWFLLYNACSEPSRRSVASYGTDVSRDEWVEMVYM